MWELDHKAEPRRIDAFELWCWRRLLRVPWTASRSNQSILQEIRPHCSLEGRMLKLKLPTLWAFDAKSYLIGKDPDAGKDWRQEKKGMTVDEMVGWHHQLNGHEFEQALRVGDGQGSLVCRSLWGCRVGHDWATELNWEADRASALYGTGRETSGSWSGDRLPETFIWSSFLPETFNWRHSSHRFCKHDGGLCL